MSRQESIRREIMLQLYGVRPITRSAEQIARECKRQGDDFTATEIKPELQFLADEGLLIQISEPGTTMKLYRIHSNGVRHYEEHYAS